ncbi:MAG: hypothetical protein ABIA04_00940 [Pseudomonadota bacterium]
MGNLKILKYFLFFIICIVFISCKQNNPYQYHYNKKHTCINNYIPHVVPSPPIVPVYYSGPIITVPIVPAPPIIIQHKVVYKKSKSKARFKVRLEEVKNEDPQDPAEPDPVDPDPIEPDPVDPDPIEPDPVEPDPIEPDPVEPDPIEPDPVEPDPVDPDPVDPNPVDPDPVDPDPVDPDPGDAGPCDSHTNMSLYPDDFEGCPYDVPDKFIMADFVNNPSGVTSENNQVNILVPNGDFVKTEISRKGMNCPGDEITNFVKARIRDNKGIIPDNDTVIKAFDVYYKMPTINSVISIGAGRLEMDKAWIEYQGPVNNAGSGTRYITGFLKKISGQNKVTFTLVDLYPSSSVAEMYCVDQKHKIWSEFSDIDFSDIKKASIDSKKNKADREKVWRAY